MFPGLDPPRVGAVLDHESSRSHYGGEAAGIWGLEAGERAAA